MLFVLCFVLFSDTICRRNYSQENGMFSLAFSVVASVLIASYFHFGKADLSLSMLDSSTNTHESGKIWYLLAYTQTTTVLPQFQVKPDLRG